MKSLTIEQFEELAAFIIEEFTKAQAYYDDHWNVFGDEDNDDFDNAIERMHALGIQSGLATVGHFLGMNIIHERDAYKAKLKYDYSQLAQKEYKIEL